MDSHPTARRAASARRPATIGMLCAVTYAAMLIGQVVPAVQGILSYDPKDVVVVIGGFIYGPLTAVLISAITSLVEMLTVSSTGPVGFIMNVVSTCSFAVPAALIYKRARSMKGAIWSLVAGVGIMAAMMCLWNYIVTPLYQGVPRQVVASMLPTLFLPFNLVKGAINAGLTLLLYKPVVTALRKANLVEESSSAGKGKVNTGALLLGGALVVTGTLLILVLLEVI